MIIDNADDHEMFFGPPSREDALTYVSDDSKSSVPVKLAKCIPECPHGAVLVTTRFKEVALDITRGPNNFKLYEMSLPEAVDLMRTRLRDESPMDDDLKDLAKRLECLPLALAQAAAYMQRNTITAATYIKRLEESDEHTIALLSAPFDDAARDSAVPNSVTATWMMTFKQLKTRNPQAADLLSLMTFFNRQEIPHSLLLSEHGDTIALEETLGALKSCSLISAGNGDQSHQTYDLHRLIQLVMQKWLRLEKEFDYWTGEAISTMGSSFSINSASANYSEELQTCARYYPHILAVLCHPVDSNHDPLARAKLLERTADYMDHQQQYRDLLPISQECVDIWTKALGPEDQQTLRGTCWLSYAYSRVGALREAVNLQVSTLEVQKRTLGVDDLDTLDSMGTLATIYTIQGRFDEAIVLQTHVIESTKGVTDPNDPVTSKTTELNIETMQALALSYCRLERLEEAKVLLVQVLQYWKRTRGPLHPDTLKSISLLGQFYTEQGRYDEAEELINQALNSNLQLFGSEHPKTLLSRSSLAWNYWYQGKYSEAETLISQLLESQNKVLGLEHPSTLVSMTILAKCWMSQGYEERAISKLQEVVRLSDRVLGADSINFKQYAQWLEQWQTISAQRSRALENIHAELAKANTGLDTSSDSGKHKPFSFKKLIPWRRRGLKQSSAKFLK